MNPMNHRLGHGDRFRSVSINLRISRDYIIFTTKTCGRWSQVLSCRFLIMYLPFFSFMVTHFCINILIPVQKLLRTYAGQILVLQIEHCKRLKLVCGESFQMCIVCHNDFSFRVLSMMNAATTIYLIYYRR